MRIKTKLWGLASVVLVLSIWAGSSHAVVGKPMIIYSEEGQTAVKYSPYSSGSWATGATAVDVASSNEKYWKVAKTHPGGAKKAAIFVQNNATPHLYAALWDESQWDDGTGSPYGDAKDLGQISTKDYRCFDAAYEQLSGKLMVVAATGINTISYWTWDAGTWSGPSTYTFSSSMANIRWIRLAAKPAANEITLIASDSGLKANALVWRDRGSGMEWGDETNLTASSLANSTTETIAVEYMRQGSEMGKAVVFWATSTANYLNAQVWSGSSWVGPYSKSGQSAYMCWLTVKADPNSNLIAIAYVDSSNDIYLIAWNGRYDAQGPWYLNRIQVDTSAFGSYANHRMFDVIFETGANGGNDSYYQGDLLMVYSNSGFLYYRDCEVSGVQSFNCGAGGHTVTGGTRAWWVQLERAPDNTVHLAIHDENDDLVTWTWGNYYDTFVRKNTISTDLERDTNHNHEVFALFPMPEARVIVTWSDNNSGPDIKTSRYHNGAMSSPYTIASTTNYQFWKVVRSSADGSKQIALSVESETSSAYPYLRGSIYNGSSWTSLKDFERVWAPMDPYDSTYDVRYRDFDAAFETSSGEILVVATKAGPTYMYECWYWTYNGSTWTGPTSLQFNGIWSGRIKWVRLASNPNASSNEIALIVGSEDGTTRRTVGRIWDGSSWGTDKVLSAENCFDEGYYDQEGIAVEYMQAGSNRGKALFAWMKVYSINGWVWNGSDWDPAAKSWAVPGPTTQWLRMAADPTSDDIMAAYSDSDGELHAIKWTGADWETSVTTISSDPLCSYVDYNRPFDVKWESGYGHTGHAIIAYANAYNNNCATNGNVYYKHYGGSSWGAEAAAASGYGAYWIELVRTTDNTIHLTIHDYTTPNHFVTLTWDNSSWSYKSVSSGILLDWYTNGLEYGKINNIDHRYAQVFSITPVATTTPQIHAIDYNFGTAGQTITIYGVGFGNATGTVKFYDNKTASVTSWSDVKIVVTVPSGTTSGYLTVTRGSNTDTICFNAITGAPTVTAVVPDKGSNFSDIDMAYITGTNFSPGLTLKVKKSGQSDITATNVTVASSNRIEVATFNITSAATGLWNVEVTNPDTNVGTGNNLFAIHSPYQVTTGTQANYADLAYPNERHLVRDSSGNWYAVFYSNDTGRIYITRSTDGGLSWDSPTTLVGTGGIIDTNAPFRFVSVDVYRTGNITNDRIHIVWRRGIDSDSSKYLWYSRCINLASYTSGASWKKADEVTTGFEQLDNTSIASEYLTYPDIAVDSGGYPHVAWNYNYAVGTSESIRYRTTRPSGSWATTIIVAQKNETGCGAIPVGYPSIDTDSSNYVHISYSQYYNTTTNYVIRYAKSTNYTSFTKSNIIEDSSRPFYQSSLVVDSANKIYVAALDNTNRDLFWAYYNGSTWSANNNLTNGLIDIESAVVGAKMGSGNYDHILLAKVYDASSNKKVIYWRWDSANSNWSKYSEDLDTGNESRSYVTIEKHAPASFEGMGYLFYDTSGDRLYIDTMADLGKFEYKRKMTLNCSGRGSSCSGGLSNFPVLIDSKSWSLADKYALRTVSNGGHVCRSDGYDIVFRASDGITQLDHEIEKYGGGSTSTIEVRVSASSDDAEQCNGKPEGSTPGLMYLDSSDLEFVRDDDPEGGSLCVGNQNIGLRFQNVQIPQGATITKAYIEFETDETDTETTNLTFYAQAIDNAPTFTTTAYDITNRTKTSASVAWNNVSAWNVESEKHQTPDLSTIIHEVINRPGWKSGNSLAIIVNGSGQRITEAYDGEPANAPLLHVEYSEGLVAWVRIPTLFDQCPTTGTDIYMYYGNPEITVKTENPTGVWDTNFKAVWHLAESSGTQVGDSTSYANTGTKLSATEPNPAAGKIAGAQNFDGLNDVIDINNSSGSGHVLDFTAGPFTISAWFNQPIAQVRHMVGKRDGASDQYQLGVGSLPDVFFSGDGEEGYGSWPLSLNSWYYYAVVVDASGYPNLYKNGALDTWNNSIGTRPFTFPHVACDVSIGARWAGYPSTAAWFTGLIDEVRISNVARDDCWIGTEYNNQSNPGGFISLGTEGPAGPTAIELNSFTARGEGSSVNVQWETKTEIHNLGFNLYRSTERNGTYTKLNNSLISGLLSSVRGKKYSFTDANVTKGKLYYYKLEDIDLKGERTFHGPVCVDWDGDGFPDDRDSDVGNSDQGSGGGNGSGGGDRSGEYPGKHEGSMVTRVELRSLEAHQTKDGVLLKWQTGYEVNNLGFHVYREENGQLVRLTPELVAGSALIAGSRTALTAGHRYHWWDVSVTSDQLSVISGQSSSLDTRHSPLDTLKYWLEDIDLSGKRTMHGPAEVQSPAWPTKLGERSGVISDQLSVSKKIKPELLSEIGLRLNERYQHYWKVQELRERLKTKNVNRYTLLGKTNNDKTNNNSRITNNKMAGTLLKGRRSGPRGNPVPDPQTQQLLAGRPAVKLFVKEEGWYRVNQPELVAAGLSPRINSRYLQLYVDGREQPIGVMGKGFNFDAIEFYGVGLDTPSTDTRVYWLVEGSKPGKRIHGYRGCLGSLSSSSFPYTVEKKERMIYVPALKNGDEENFFGSVVYGSRVDQLLEVKHLDRGSSGDALLEVALQGATTGTHRVKVNLNDEEVGEVVFEGQSKKMFQVEVSQAFLQEGDNLVTLIPQGGEMDVSLVDSIRLTYWHSYTADDNSLRMRVRGGSWVSIDGFSQSDIRVFDVTDSNEVIEVIGKVESRKGSYTIDFRVPGHGERTLLALSEDRVKNPVEIVSNHPSAWNQERGGYGLLIISHRDFLTSLEPLITLRESQGYRVALIDVEDLHDEFSFGNKSPKAIKDFLASAKANWRRAPRFVLLVGDASFDPRNYFGLGDLDFVPTKLIDTQYLETASDDWFVDLNSDGLPEIAIGRLPVQTKEEAGTVVSKIVNYEQSSGMNGVLLVADRGDTYDFEGAAEEVEALLPPSSLPAKKVFRGSYGSDDLARNDLLSAMNQGPLLVNFVGHGSQQIWRGSLLTSDDADSLTNGNRLSFFVNMTCLNGYFQDVSAESMAEALLMTTQGGALAVWASSGLTYPEEQSLMDMELIRLLFNGEGLTLGEVVIRAKAATNDQDVRRTWILFGDPTTRLRP